MHSEERGVAFICLFGGSGGCGGAGVQTQAQVKCLVVGLYNPTMPENTMGFFEK